MNALKPSGSPATSRKTVMRSEFYFFVTVLSSFIIFFLVVRSPEVVSMVTASPMYALMVVVIFVALLVIAFYPPRLLSGLVKRVGLLLLVSNFDTHVFILLTHYDIFQIETTVLGCISIEERHGYKAVVRSRGPA